MVTIETTETKGGVAGFVLGLARLEIVKRLGMLSAVTAVIFAGLVIWLRP